MKNNRKSRTSSGKSVASTSSRKASSKGQAALSAKAVSRTTPRLATNHNELLVSQR